MAYVTERQRDILNFIKEYQKESGVAPTHREICDHFGFSSYGTVYKHLSLLEKKGLIRRDWNQKRGVELVEKEEQREPAAGVRELPLFGYIAQIAILQFLRAGMRRTDSGPVLLVLSFIVAVVLTVLAVTALDRARSKSPAVNRMYNGIFA